MLIFFGRDISLYFTNTLTFKIFCNKPPVIHVEIILHILQRGIVVSHHQICIFADDMDLLNLLFVELAEHTVVFLFVTQPVVFDASNIHGIIEYKEATFKFQSANLRQIEQCLFDIFEMYVL